MSAPQQPIASAPEPTAAPAQLAGLTISPSPGVTSTTADAKESVLTTPKVGSAQFSSFISLVHSYLWSSVTFADQKAAFLFAIDSAFLGYLLSNGLLREMRHTQAWQLAQWLSLTSLVFFGLSIGMAIYVVMPRLGGNRTGLIYFMAIASRRNREAYVAEVLSSSDSSLSSALAEHSYEVARIATRKYRNLRFGVWVGIIGFVSGLLYIGITQ